MEQGFSNKINVLKAIAILIVVAGHLEFSLIPMFPPYSFQVILFFFIAGMLFNEKYGFIEYFKRRFKSLMVPYILYCLAYLGITYVITPFTGKFWGMQVNIYNEFVIPFLTGHQLDLISPLWFVPQLFTTLIIYKILNYIKIDFKLRAVIYLIISIIAIQMEPLAGNLYILWLLRTMFSLFFVHLGYIFTQRIYGKTNIFNFKILTGILILQAILWLTNADYTPSDGIGLSYILVWGEFDNWIVPILTSLTGIWITLFVVENFYNYLKDWKFFNKIGQNTYHIMANHILVFNIITYTILAIKGIPFDVKNSQDIYWFYCPMKTTYFYFITGIVLTTYLGEFFKFIKRALIKI